MSQATASAAVVNVSTQLQGQKLTPEQQQENRDRFHTLATEFVGWWAGLDIGEQNVIGAEWDESGLAMEEFVLDLAQYGSYAEYQGEEPEAKTGDAAAQLVADAAAAEEQAEEQRKKLQAQADGTLKSAAKAFEQGERASRAKFLHAGELSDTYVHQRMQLGHSRANAVQALVGEFAKHASGTMTAATVNDMIGAYHAYRLLDGNPKTRTPYGTFKECWSQCVQRTAKDTPDESWVLWPGYEERVKSLYAECVKAELKRDDVLSRVKGLHREYATYQAAETKRKAEAQREVVNVAKAEQEAAKLATVRQYETVAKAEAAAQAEADAAKKAELTAKADAEKAELLARQKAEREASAKAEQEARDKAKAENAEREAQKAKERAEKAAEKASEKAERKATATARPPVDSDKKRDPNPVGQLLLSAEQATAKDWAATCWTLLSEHAEPEDVLEALLDLARHSGKLSKSGQRACDAALTLLKRQTPVAASANGTPVTAGAA